MGKRLIVGVIAVMVSLTGALWFLYDETLPARLLSWLPRTSHRFSVPPDVAVLLREEPENHGESREGVGKDLRVLFVGDTSFGESYHSKSFFESKGYEYSLKKLISMLHRSDVVIANLETPLTNLTRSPFSGKKKYIHWGDMHEVPATLKNHNVKFVSLANNHSLDYGVEGLLQTLLALRRNDIAWFGAGLDASQASRPLRSHFMLEKHSFDLIVASGFEYEIRYDLIYDFYARSDFGGINCWTRKSAVEQIREIRQLDRRAFIVAFPHWGRNYRFRVEEQTKLAHALIEAGSDLVIGHGAHILQEIEYYKGQWILYGIGNFVFNSPGRYQKEHVDPFSLAVSLDVVDNGGHLGLKLRLYPIFSDNLISGYQPRLVTEEELGKVRNFLLQNSSDPVYLQRELYVGEDEIGLFLTLDITAHPQVTSAWLDQ